MRNVADIEASYLRVDAMLDAQMAATDETHLSRIRGAQIINDQAYFLLCWGQLEVEIDQKCRAAIKRRRNNPDWSVRRAWELYNPDDPRLSGLSFDNRVKLVLDQSEGRGSPFARTMLHYEVRNRIAHGELKSSRVDVSAFVQDCYVIQGALHRVN